MGAYIPSTPANVMHHVCTYVDGFMEVRVVEVAQVSGPVGLRAQVDGLCTCLHAKLALCDSSMQP